MAHVKLTLPALFLTVLMGLARSEPLVVVVNPGSPIDHVTSEDLKALYLGKQSTVSGTSATPVNYKADNPIRVAFEKQIMKMDPKDVISHWKSQRFLGFGDNQPVAFGSVEAVKLFVAREKGAIGYLPLSAVDATVLMVKKVDDKEVTKESAQSGSYPFQMIP